MTNCWATLELAPTHDFDQISKARRALIRKWHPDTVSDPAQRDEYTVRCATINAAYDEAVKIAEIREQLFRPVPFPNVDVERELRRANRRSGFTSELAFKVASPVSGLIFVVYFLSFRISFPATILAFVFGAGALLAAGLDLLVYRYLVRPLLTFVGMEKRAVLPWALLVLVNLAALAWTVPDGDLIFQTGFVLVVPLWRAWRWARGERTPTASAEF